MCQAPSPLEEGITLSTFEFSGSGFLGPCRTTRDSQRRPLLFLLLGQCGLLLWRQKIRICICIRRDNLYIFAFYLSTELDSPVPAVNSVPASSAVERNSSSALSCVMLCSFTQFGSLWVSVVCYESTMSGVLLQLES